MTERRNYTMTPTQFAAMGGQTAPEGYDPDAAQVFARQGLTYQHVVRGKRLEVREGVVQQRTVNPTDPSPGIAPVPLHVIQELALYYKVKPLSIHWPDKYSPDFTAVPV